MHSFRGRCDKKKPSLSESDEDAGVIHNAGQMFCHSVGNGFFLAECVPDGVDLADLDT